MCVCGGGWGGGRGGGRGEGLNDPGGKNLEMQNLRQQLKHAKLYSKTFSSLKERSSDSSWVLS